MALSDLAELLSELWSYHLLALLRSKGVGEEDLWAVEFWKDRRMGGGVRVIFFPIQVAAIFSPKGI